MSAAPHWSRVAMLVAMVSAALWWSQREPPPAPSTVVRGVSLGLFASDPGYDYGDLLAELRQRGATDVLLVVNWTQRDRFAHDIAPMQGWSPSGDTLERTLAQARAQGLRVALMPVVRLRHRPGGEWRGQIEPREGVDAWFKAYRRFLSQMADAAARHQVERLVVGSELCSLEQHEAQWRALIQETRQRYRGKLLYSANWDHQGLPFWDALDEVGVTGYYPLAQGPQEPDALEIRQAWRAPQEELRQLRQRTGKPVLLTEIGYATHPDAAWKPWETSSPRPPRGAQDLALQARLYEGFCDAFQRRPSVDGFYFWNWFGHGGPRDRGFSPRGKPAAASMSDCLRSQDWNPPGALPETPRLAAGPIRRAAP